MIYMEHKKAIKILIIRLSSIGDIILTTPFIRWVRISYPAARIDFIIKKEFAELIRENPHLDRIYELDIENDREDMNRIRAQLIKEGYDYIFDLHNNLRSRYLRRGLKAKRVRKIKKNKLVQQALVHFKINKYKEILPIAERYYRVAEKDGVQKDNLGAEIYWRNQTENSIKPFLNRKQLYPNERYFTVGPGAGFFTKQWPVEYFEELGKEILKYHYPLKMVIVGGPGDVSAAKKLCFSRRVINLTGRLNLLQTAMVISKSEFLIANDSGLMHMATAVNTPVVGIFGSTVKEFGFFPYVSESLIVENKLLNCRPCSHIGRNECPKGHFKCMLDIKPEMVYQQMKHYLKD